MNDLLDRWYEWLRDTRDDGRSSLNDIRFLNNYARYIESFQLEPNEENATLVAQLYIKEQ